MRMRPAPVRKSSALVIWLAGEGMEKIFGGTDSLLDFTQKEEKTILGLVNSLIRLNARPAATAVMKLVKAGKWNEPFGVEHAPLPNPEIPEGPFKRNREAALLLYVPRDLEGRLIDDVSGGYGYSHLAVDCGETDEATGKPVMVESTVHVPVRRCFLDTYGGRHYLRIPLRGTGIDAGPFCDCVLSRLGEHYDYLEALTWGEVDDPARQVCSNLATDCLPETLRLDLIKQREDGRLSPKAISLHPRKSGKIGIFISPNGFAEYFRAPNGKNVTRPGETFTPKNRRGLPEWLVFWRNRHGWMYVMSALAASLGLLLWQWQGKWGLFARR